MSSQNQEHLLSMGIGAVSDLRDILKAISALADATGNSIISKLADIGVRSANDSHNSLEAAVEELK